MKNLIVLFMCVGTGMPSGPDATRVVNSEPGDVFRNMLTSEDGLLEGEGDKDWADNLEGAEILLDETDDESMDHSGRSPTTRSGRVSETVRQPAAIPASSMGSDRTVKVVTASNMGADRTNKVVAASVPHEHVGSKYSAIEKFRSGKMCFPDLMGGECTVSRVGTFRNEGDSRIRFAKERNDIVGMTNQSFSFDPETLTCSNCPVAHPVLKARMPHKVDDTEDDRVILVLSDQNFPAVLPATTVHKKCLVIIRVENATLAELLEHFTLICKAAEFPRGGIIILSSASHLARVGTTQYGMELVRIGRVIHSLVGHGCNVTPGAFILGGGTNDPALLQSMNEIYTWLSKMDGGGHGFLLLKEAYKVGIAQLTSINEVGTIKLCTRISLPTKLDSEVCSSWTSLVGDNSPILMDPCSEGWERAFINAIIQELISKTAIDLCDKPSLNRSPIPVSSKASDPDHILLVGSSHAQRLCQYLDMLDVKFTSITIPGWRATKCKAMALALEISKFMANRDPDCLYKTVVIFQLFDNSVYMAKTEDGAIMPCRKEGESHRYHVDGDLMLAPKELLRDIINTCTPVLKAAGETKKIIVTPLPRYTAHGCCGDADHAPNRNSAGFKEKLLTDLDSMRRDIKDLCFNANLRNFRVINLGRVVEERSENWGSDPVHMLPDCYSKLAGLLMEEAKKFMETSTTPSKNKPSAVERASKRHANNSPGRDEKRNRLQQLSHQSHGGPGLNNSAWHWRSNHGRRGGWRPRRGGYQGRRGW